MEMNYFKKTGKMMVAACMLAGLPFIPDVYKRQPAVSSNRASPFVSVVVV